MLSKNIKNHNQENFSKNHLTKKKTNHNKLFKKKYKSLLKEVSLKKIQDTIYYNKKKMKKKKH